MVWLENSFKPFLWFLLFFKFTKHEVREQSNVIHPFVLLDKLCENQRL